MWATRARARIVTVTLATCGTPGDGHEFRYLLLAMQTQESALDTNEGAVLPMAPAQRSSIRRRPGSLLDVG